MKALFIPLFLGLVSSCASAGAHRGEEVGGLFDDDDGNYDKESAPAMDSGRYGGGGGDDAPMAMAESEEISLAESAPSGLFDFAGEMFEGKVKDAPPPPPPPPANQPLPKGDETSTKAAESSEGAQPGKRMVIYTGSLTVMVTNISESLDRLAARVEAANGYVQTRTGNTSSNNGVMTVRIPAQEFHKLVKELAGYGQLINEQISANDVTKQMFDIELRLETATKSRERLVDLLKTATKMEEILQIENEIRRLTQEIEAMKGELRYLKDQVAFSTLTVTFYSNAPPPTPGPHRTRSRFEWINQVGIEHVLGEF